LSKRRSASEISVLRPPLPLRLWQAKQLKRCSVTRAACVGAGLPAPLVPSVRKERSALRSPSFNAKVGAAPRAFASSARQPALRLLPDFRASKDDFAAWLGSALPPGEIV